MTRMFKEPVVSTATPADMISFERFGEFSHCADSHAECRAGGLKAGTVVPWSGGAAVVVYIIPHRRRLLGDIIPCYRCATWTKAGTWSRQWRDLWPGEIERTFEALGRAAPKESTPPHSVARC